ncbi:2Fe-2S iron-sulfur cluster-binding protein [Bradyrhizobium sp. 18]|uniref:2Fe-2S iron-sulfur cluster-binding protein n=1 Tax=Bradyrhizobium sp. 18 TaxID=2782657 RepID=UPI001FF8BC0D|nr:2Fe-2S iron-sulfur cluster-binding protein [Bradyrhizobium sp. 18]MCK1509365.1 2Fe-2S iron-sulfur cluster binding domain-containing protein [Bradyrhizobium sp. 18]
MKIFVYDGGGAAVQLIEPASKTLMQAIRDAGLSIAAQCGGGASCATCHVYVDDAWRAKLRPADDTESAMLDFAEARRESSRLSCQIELSEELDGLTVTLAPGAAF